MSAGEPPLGPSSGTPTALAEILDVPEARGSPAPKTPPRSGPQPPGSGSGGSPPSKRVRMSSPQVLAARIGPPDRDKDAAATAFQALARRWLVRRRYVRSRGHARQSVLLRPSVSAVLQPHQRVGVRWLHGAFCRGGGILADDPGLGKTIQVLALLDALVHGSSLAPRVGAPSPTHSARRGCPCAGAAPSAQPPERESSRVFVHPMT